MMVVVVLIFHERRKEGMPLVTTSANKNNDNDNDNTNNTRTRQDGTGRVGTECNLRC